MNDANSWYVFSALANCVLRIATYVDGFLHFLRLNSRLFATTLQIRSLSTSILSANAARGLFSNAQVANASARRKIIRCTNGRHRAHPTKWERLPDHYFTSCSSGFWLHGLIRRDCGDGEGRVRAIKRLIDREENRDRANARVHTREAMV